MEDKEMLVGPPGAYAAYVMALNAGVKLSVDLEHMQILANPKGKVTPDVAAGIKENRDDILKILLYKRAVDHLQKEAREMGPQNAQIVAEATFSDRDEVINEAFEDDIGGFRATLRHCVTQSLKAAKREAGRVKREKGAKMRAPAPPARVPQVEVQETLEEGA